MQDSEILATVYRWMSQSLDRGESAAVMGNRLEDCKTYIDEQWKIQDEHEKWQSELFAKNDDGQQYIMDASEMERHRGLEIGPDGTVTDLK